MPSTQNSVWLIENTHWMFVGGQRKKEQEYRIKEWKEVGRKPAAKGFLKRGEVWFGQLEVAGLRSVPIGPLPPIRSQMLACSELFHSCINF